MTARAPRALVWGALATVYVVWSSTYLGIRVVVRSMPALLSAGARFALAGLLLLAIDRARGAILPDRRAWLRAAPAGVLLFAGGSGLVALAERTAESGATALACALAPVWAALAGLFWGERPGARQWLGFALGVAGVATLSVGALPDRASAILLLLAPLCWAAGTLVAKRAPSPASAQLVLGGLATCAIGAARGESWPAHVPTSAWLAWVYLALVGSTLAYSAYLHLVRHASVAVAMSYAYVNPVLAVLLGAALGDERAGPAVLLAAALVTAAVVLIVRPARRAA